MVNYICLICDQKSSQKSHHKTHLESEKHNDKAKVKKLELEN